MTCVRIYFEKDGERRRADFVYFDNCTERSASSYYKRERHDIKIKKVIMADTWDEIIKENGNGMVQKLLE